MVELRRDLLAIFEGAEPVGVGGEEAPRADSESVGAAAINEVDVSS